MSRLAEILLEEGVNCNEIPFLILTKNKNVLRDLDLFTQYNNCYVGFTIITLNENFKGSWEPYTSSIEDRIEALTKLKDNGIKTYEEHLEKLLNSDKLSKEQKEIVKEEIERLEEQYYYDY